MGGWLFDRTRGGSAADAFDKSAQVDDEDDAVGIEPPAPVMEAPAEAVAPPVVEPPPAPKRSLFAKRTSPVEEAPPVAVEPVEEKSEKHVHQIPLDEDEGDGPRHVTIYDEEDLAPVTNSPVRPPNHVTVQQVRAALPVSLRSSVTESLVDRINALSTDDLAAQTMRENVIGYTTVLKEGQFKVEDYVNAVAYVSYKMMEMTNEEAWSRTFPDRHVRLVSKGATSKVISSHVSAYHRRDIVAKLMEQVIIPPWVAHQDLFNKALMRQTWLMTNANSEKVQTDAANSLIQALKKPEPVKGGLKVDIVANSGMKELTDALHDLAENQREAIRGGRMKTIEVAGAVLVSEDIEDV